MTQAYPSSEPPSLKFVEGSVYIASLLCHSLGQSNPMHAAQQNGVKRYRRQELEQDEQLPIIEEDEEWVLSLSPLATSVEALRSRNLPAVIPLQG